MACLLSARHQGHAFRNVWETRGQRVLANESTEQGPTAECQAMPSALANRALKHRRTGSALLRREAHPRARRLYIYYVHILTTQSKVAPPPTKNIKKEQGPVNDETFTFVQVETPQPFEMTTRMPQTCMRERKKKKKQTAVTQATNQNTCKAALNGAREPK